MKTIEQIKSEVLAKWPDAEIDSSSRGWRVWWQNKLHATFFHSTPDAAWEQALKFINLQTPTKTPGAPGMRPETLALIQGEIDRLGMILNVPAAAPTGVAYCLALKHELDFLGKVLASERQA